MVDQWLRIPLRTACKSGELRDSVVVTGADGYEAVLCYGEIAPTFGDRPALLSLKEDGVVLAAPRLVVPGDVLGGRDVSEVYWCPVCAEMSMLRNDGSCARCADAPR